MEKDPLSQKSQFKNEFSLDFSGSLLDISNIQFQTKSFSAFDLLSEGLSELERLQCARERERVKIIKFVPNAIKSHQEEKMEKIIQKNVGDKLNIERYKKTD